VLERSVATLGAQVLMLQAAGEKRGLDPSERAWLLDVHDRLAMLEGQRMRLVTAVLVSDKLSPEQRSSILAELTGVRPVLDAVEVKP
jgi:hypothetical protein